MATVRGALIRQYKSPGSYLNQRNHRQKCAVHIWEGQGREVNEQKMIEWHDQLILESCWRGCKNAMSIKRRTKVHRYHHRHPTQVPADLQAERAYLYHIIAMLTSVNATWPMRIDLFICLPKTNWMPSVALFIMRNVCHLFILYFMSVMNRIHTAYNIFYHISHTNTFGISASFVQTDGA